MTCMDSQTAAGAHLYEKFLEMKSMRGVGLACTLTCLDEHRLARYDGCFQRELALPISTPRMTPGSRILATSSNEHSLTVLVLMIV